jgi:PBSX family phage terminase large subunit
LTFQVPVGKQRDFCLGSDARVNIAHGAVRSAKTVGANVRWLRAVLEAPAGSNLLMAGKTLGALERNVLSPISQLVGSNNFDYKRSLKTATIYGRKILCEGGNDEAAYTKIAGLTLHSAYVDEGSLHPESFINMLMTRLSEPGAQLFLTTNPGNPGHYLKKRWLDREAELDLKSWHFRLEDNPWLDWIYVEELKRQFGPPSSLFYQRYIDGLWVAAEGAVYRNFNRDLHCIPKLPDGRIEELRVAVDPGATHPTAFLKAYRIADKWYIGGEYRKADRSPAEVSKDLKGFLVGMYPTSIDVDPAAKAHRLQFIGDGLQPVTAADNDVLNGIQKVINAFDQGWLQLVGPATPMLQEELEGYRWDPKATERGEDAPIKEDDDLVDCLRYLVNRISKSRRLPSPPRRPR